LCIYSKYGIFILDDKNQSPLIKTSGL
jgi:hypothetical protein